MNLTADLWLQSADPVANGQTYLIAVLAIALLSLIAAAFLAKHVISQDTGSPEMQKISDAIKQGAEAFMARQNRTILTLAIAVPLLSTSDISSSKAIRFSRGA